MIRLFKTFSFLSFVILLLISGNLKATTPKTYYVSEKNGSDLYHGQSEEYPFKSIEAINKIRRSLVAGDRVLFERGGAYNGSLTITNSLMGTEENPIVFGAYGDDKEPKPIIHGWQTITGWKQYNDSVWGAPADVNPERTQLYFDGENAIISTSDEVKSLSNSTSSYIIDNSIPNKSNIIDWEYTKIILKTSAFSVSHRMVENIIGDTIYFDRASASGSKRFIMQNNKSLMNSYKSWYVTEDSVFVNFGKEDPDNHLIKMSQVEELIGLFNSSYVTFENLDIQGASKYGIIVNYGGYSNVKILNCDFSMCTGGVYMYSDSSTIENCTFNDIADMGITTDGFNNRIRNNTLNNIGNYYGYIAGSQGCMGMQVIGDSSIIEYNSLSNIGYHGIYFQGDYVYCSYNYIYNSVFEVGDGGAIYTNLRNYNYREISHNIIDGSGDMGIYLDNLASNCHVFGNSVSNVQYYGLKFNMGSHNEAYNNTFVNSELHVQHMYGDPSNYADSNTIKNNTIVVDRKENNWNNAGSWICIGISGTPGPFCNDIDLNSYWLEDSTQRFAEANQTGDITGQPYFADWQGLYNHDENGTLNQYDNVKYHYNNTVKDLIVRFTDQKMTDTEGRIHKGAILLKPYTSVVFVKSDELSKSELPTIDLENISKTIDNTISHGEIIHSITPPEKNQSYTFSIEGIENKSEPLFSIDKVTGKITVATNLAEFVKNDTVVNLNIKFTENSIDSLQFKLQCKVIIIDSYQELNVDIHHNSELTGGFEHTIYAEVDMAPNNSEKDEVIPLTFHWSTPENLQEVKSLNDPELTFLAPVVEETTTYSATLNVSDGIRTTTIPVIIEIEPHKPYLQKVNVAEVKTNIYIGENHHSNIIDGDYNTYWESKDIGDWVVLELATAVDPEYLTFAFYNNQDRKSYFDILLSNDEEKWEDLNLDVATCGFSNNNQSYELPPIKSASTYKFIKIVGKGNDIDNKNYISEVKIFAESNNTGTDSKYEEIVEVIPNRLSNQITIKNTEVGEMLYIADIQGKVLLTKELNAIETIVDINIPSGVYFATVVSNTNESFSRKFVIY